MQKSRIPIAGPILIVMGLLIIVTCIIVSLSQKKNEWWVRQISSDKFAVFSSNGKTKEHYALACPKVLMVNGEAVRITFDKKKWALDIIECIAPSGKNGLKNDHEA